MPFAAGQPGRGGELGTVELVEAVGDPDAEVTEPAGIVGPPVGKLVELAYVEDPPEGRLDANGMTVTVSVVMPCVIVLVMTYWARSSPEMIRVCKRNPLSEICK